MQTTQNITLKRLLALTAERQASDLLLVVGNKPVLKTAGNLLSLEEEEVVTQDFLLGAVDSILTEGQKSDLARDREVIFAYDFMNHSRFRVDITWQRNLLTVIFHHLPAIIKRLSDIGFPREVIDLTTRSHGLVLIGGQPGSGKTTTLAAFAETINHSAAKHILLLEQPIEFSLVSYRSVIEQQEIGQDSPDWLAALEIEEQAVDVLLVGKIVSAEVLKKLLRLAQNGVLVVAAHESGSTGFLIESLLNLIDQKERSFYARVLSEVYQGSVVQKLLPQVGGGQILALEVAFASQALGGAIRDQKFDHVSNTIQTSRSEGMISLDRYILELVNSGQVDKQVALAEVKNKDIFK